MPLRGAPLLVFLTCLATGVEIPGATTVSTQEEMANRLARAHGREAVVFIFSAVWCGPCKVYEGTLRDAPAPLRERLVLVDADVAGDLVARLGISRLPTTLIMSGGTTPVVITGPLPLPVLMTAVARQESESTAGTKGGGETAVDLSGDAASVDNNKTGEGPRPPPIASSPIRR
jgi:thioredoxin-like negative regulator of GroEL